jgi:hypothetical protein
LRWPAEQRILVPTPQMALAATGFVGEGQFHRWLATFDQDFVERRVIKIAEILLDGAL